MTDNTTAYGEVTWHFFPQLPETLRADTEMGPSYLYECVGTIPHPDNENELVRVFVPYDATPKNLDVIGQLNDKWGRYADSLGEARDMNGFTESPAKLTVY